MPRISGVTKLQCWTPPRAIQCFLRANNVERSIMNVPEPQNAAIEPKRKSLHASEPEHETGELVIEPAYERLDEVRALIIEYMDWLATEQTGLDECLARQSYDDELDHLGRKYGMPQGRLFVAHFGGPAIGCIALRPMPELPEQNACEMKRLYVKPGNRGHHIGKRLVQRLIEEAREAGYERMYLDTLPVLQAAISMYHSFGFEDIPRYNDNPIPEAVYMKLEL